MATDDTRFYRVFPNNNDAKTWTVWSTNTTGSTGTVEFSGPTLKDLVAMGHARGPTLTVHPDAHTEMIAAGVAPEELPNPLTDLLDDR